MSVRRLFLSALAAVAIVAAAPDAAFAHAALLKTLPQASVTLARAPDQVALTYSEPVEPRFAVVSVTDAAGHQESDGPPRRAPADPDTLLVPLRSVGEGWYLVYWRAISVDGHPVRGAFTFAVGPNAGPAPQFPIPSTSESAATPRLLVARWVVFLSVMAAIGLLALRLAIARPVVRRVSGTSLRQVTVAFFVAAAIGLIATPVYLLLATADFALRSVFALSAIVPLVHLSAFGRGYLDLEACFALFAVAGLIAIWVDRPERDRRSIAEIVAGLGALLAAGATLLIPGASGHPAQTAPRGLALALDWLHLASGSLWVGGLIGLLVLWRCLPVASRVAGLVVAVPRFSNVALGSVLVLIASGTWASFLHLPTLASAWQTAYGQALLVKIGVLLAALALAAVNLLRTKDRLGKVAVGAKAATLLRRLVGGEALLVAAAVFAAAVLSSLAPPSKALAAISGSTARVGPGAVSKTVTKGPYRLSIHVSPNKAAVSNSFSIEITRGGAPVRGATVLVRFSMLDMAMQDQLFRFVETAPGRYEHAAPALVMVGHWGLSFNVAPKDATPFDVLLVDHATG